MKSQCVCVKNENTAIYPRALDVFYCIAFWYNLHLLYSMPFNAHFPKIFFYTKEESWKQQEGQKILTTNEDKCGVDYSWSRRVCNSHIDLSNESGFINCLHRKHFFLETWFAAIWFQFNEFLISSFFADIYIIHMSRILYLYLLINHLFLL